MHTQTCTICGKMFNTKTTTKTCSPECRKEHYSRWAKQYKPKVGYSRVCTVCKKPFVALKITKFICDLKCANKKRNSNKKYRHYVPKTKMNCEVCGKVFMADGRNYRVCNRKGCKKINSERTKRNIVDRAPRVKKRYPRTCVQCGKKFVAYYSKKVTCDFTCYSANRSAKDKLKRKIRPLFTQFCIGCGTSFMVSNRHKVFHSKVCRQHFYSRAKPWIDSKTGKTKQSIKSSTKRWRDKNREHVRKTTRTLMRKYNAISKQQEAFDAARRLLVKAPK